MVALGTCFLILGGMREDTPVGAWFGILACFFMIAPAVELMKYFLNRTRVELLKELKGLELQMLEIKEQMRQHQGA